MSSTEELYQIADELRAIANLGLQFADNEYHKERYTRTLSLSARLVAIVEHRSPDAVLAQLQDNLSHVSPLAGAEAAVFRDDRLLLIRRQDNGLWAMPGGLAEVGETLAQAAERELWEEAGIRGRATQLLGIFDSRLWQMQTKAQLYGIVFRVKSGDSPVPGSEALDVEFFSENDLPPLSPAHRLRVPLVFKLYRGKIRAPYFDKFGLNSYIDPRVEVRESHLNGKGIFANAPIGKNEVVVIWGGTLFSAADVQAGQAAKHSCAAIGEGLYLASPVLSSNSPDDFMNHSCDPNVWMRDAVTVIAQRDIQTGKELTIDYAMFEDDENWTADWECHCGSNQCRKMITGKDWQLAELQTRYRNHFSPFINTRIRTRTINVI